MTDTAAPTGAPRTYTERGVTAKIEQMLTDAGATGPLTRRRRVASTSTTAAEAKPSSAYSP